MEEQGCPPCQFIMIPSGDKAGIETSPADRDPYALGSPSQAESSFALSEISDSSEAIPLVVITPIHDSSKPRGDEDDRVSLGSASSGHVCNLQETFYDSFATLSTKGTMFFSSNYDNEYADISTLDSYSENGVQDHDDVDVSRHCSRSSAIERQDNSQRTTSDLGTFERRDDSYFTEGFINVGDLPFVC